MIGGFLFNSDAALQLLLIGGGILACFAAVGAVVFMMTRIVERDCRRDLWYDDDGRRNDSPRR